MNEFIAIDIETANADYSSICQVGIVHFGVSGIIEEWSTLIDPKSYFDPYNTFIHGISENQISGQPTFPEIFPELDSKLAGKIALHHGHFDRTAFERCYDLHKLNSIACDWLDGTKVVRRTWEKYARKGYGLANLSKEFGVDLDHHDALSDARAAGKIFEIAIHESGISPAQWVAEVKTRPTLSATSKDFRRDGDLEAPFFGEKIVFTGSLGVARSTAADIAQKLGFDVQNGVNKMTTFLCVGIQDPHSLAGYSKSSKHRKAEMLAQAGQELAILSEADFWAIAKTYDTGVIE